MTRQVLEWRVYTLEVLTFLKLLPAVEKIVHRYVQLFR